VLATPGAVRCGILLQCICCPPNDGERICQAIAALEPAEVIQARARQFAVLADPTRLTLLALLAAP
jgi:hypothetical protein